MDTSATLAELKALVERFVAERDWAKFHSPKNLSTAIAVEAAELMELFTWQTEAESVESVADAQRQAAIEELADVLIFALAFANQNKIDLAAAIRDKVARNREKYPVETFRGRV